MFLQSFYPNDWVSSRRGGETFDISSSLNDKPARIIQKSLLVRLIIVLSHLPPAVIEKRFSSDTMRAILQAFDHAKKIASTFQGGLHAEKSQV